MPSPATAFFFNGLTLLFQPDAAAAADPRPTRIGYANALLFQLLQQHLLVIAGKLLTLPFDGNRSLLLRLGSRVSSLSPARRFRRAAGKNFHFISHPDHPAVAGNQVLAKIDIAIVQRGTKTLCFQRLPGGMLLTALRADGGKMQRLHGLATSNTTSPMRITFQLSSSQPPRR